MRYSIHDGPGIRTTVFFKGCPLSCIWCHNPEGIEHKPEQTFNVKKCINCGFCQNEHFDKCPAGARETIGYEINISELMNEIKKDNLFYEQSGGGITFSGGEPLLQPEFLLDVLAGCKKEYINTAIDTCGFCETEIIKKAAEITDCFLYDIKFIDPHKHKDYCGVSNELILKNLKYLCETKVKLYIRIPVIPSINDDLPEMTGIFNFIKDFPNIETVHFLPYHNIHSDKYKRLGKKYGLPEISGGESPNMKAILNIFNGRFKTKIGG